MMHTMVQGKQPGESVWLFDQQTFGEIVEETSQLMYTYRLRMACIYQWNYQRIVSAPSHEDTEDTMSDQLQGSDTQPEWQVTTTWHLGKGSWTLS